MKEKTILEINPEIEGTMRWENGVMCSVNLDWDDKFYYVWFTIADEERDFLEEHPDKDLRLTIEETEDEMNRIGINKFYSLTNLNNFVKNRCGDDEPVRFIQDDGFGIFVAQP